MSNTPDYVHAYKRETAMRIAFRNAEPGAPAPIAGIVRRKLKTMAGVRPLRPRRS